MASLVKSHTQFGVVHAIGLVACVRAITYPVTRKTKDILDKMDLNTIAIEFVLGNEHSLNKQFCVT